MQNSGSRFVGPLMVKNELTTIIGLLPSGALANIGPSNCKEVTVNWPQFLEGISLGNKSIGSKLRDYISACQRASEAERLPRPRSFDIGNKWYLHIDAVYLPRELQSLLAGTKLMLIIRKTRRSSKIAAAQLEREYDLTKCEARVAYALAQGTSLQDTSSKLNVSIWTAKSHLKSIFQKTGTNRQAELVSMVNHTLG
ncbi:helix-turn-helix transcriptional regulator [Sulfitobacter sp.]|uniref:helix-turn-helix transcriptional regulator n=1 Tax=Sulfitobacter sp. TaxID=1903071 RepID=UPI0030025538